MAEQIKLVQRESYNPANVDAVDLLAISGGLAVVQDGWIPAVSDGMGIVAESITLMAKASTHDGLATLLQSLDTKRTQAENYFGGAGSEAEKLSVWLVAQLSAETAARKALIYSLRRENTGQAGQYTLDGSAGNVSRTTTIQLERGPWESTTYIDARVEAVGCLASYTDTTKTISGDMPARIGYAKIEGTGAGTLYKFWMGFRTARYGIAANFQPYWSLSKAAAFDDDTTGGKTNPDNTARESCKTITTFATVSTLLRRATIRCSDVTSYPEDQRGTFRVLLRAKITGTAVVRVRLADGMYAAAAFTSRQRVSISSTSWQFYDMGSATVPVPGRFLTSAGQEANSAMGIDAELVSGSGDLEMDCLCMVPMSEGYVYADGGIVADNNDSLVASQLPEGGAIAIAYQSYTAFKTGNCTILKGLPVGAVYVMLCAQRETESYFDGSSSDAVDIGLRYFPRWGELRGAE